MNPQPESHHEIDGDVYVSPRHLASTTGTGDPPSPRCSTSAGTCGTTRTPTCM